MGGATVAAVLSSRRSSAQRAAQRAPGAAAASGLFFSSRRQPAAPAAARQDPPAQPPTSVYSFFKPTAKSAETTARKRRQAERLSHLLTVSISEATQMLKDGGTLLEAAQRYLDTIDTSDVVACSITVEAQRLDLLDEMRDILDLDDVAARELLRKADWNLSRAIESHLMQNGGGGGGGDVYHHHQPQQQQVYNHNQYEYVHHHHVAAQQQQQQQEHVYEPSAPPLPIEESAAEVAAPFGIPLGAFADLCEEGVVMGTSPPDEPAVWMEAMAHAFAPETGGGGGGAQQQESQRKAADVVETAAAQEWQGMPLWLESHGLGQYVAVFEEQMLTDLESICSLSEEDLKDLIPTLGGRKKAQCAINALNRKRVR